MPSRLEQYKRDESQKRELQSDLAELQTLYNSYEDFYNKYTFDEFLEYATKNSRGSLDKSIENYLIQEADKDIPLKEFRKTTVPWLSETIGGSLAGARFIAEKYPSTLTRNLARLAPNEKEIRRGTDKAFRDVGRTVGLGDIWNEKKDEETGKTYYELQEPETTAGQILKPVGEYITALAVTRNPTSLFTKTAQKVPEKITKKVGRPSKAALAKEAREERTKKLLGAGKALGKAEVAAQITFADNPEFTYVASALSNYIGNDNNLMGEILNYLDTTEDSTEEARRLSLLLDGVAFSGIVSAGVGTLKVTKEGILQMLQSVKNSSQSQKESFKSLITGASKTKSARKKNVSEVPIIKDITNEDILKFGKDSLIYRSLNSGYRGVQRFYQNFLTTSGMYSDEMFKMLKSADYNKIGWSKRASEIHAKLVTSIAKAAKTSKFSEKEIDDILNQYLKGKKTLASLPKEVRPWAKEAKGEITNLSKMFLESNYIPPQMKKVIEENMGSYLRKTYQFYENKNWRPSQEVIDEVTNTIAASIQKAKGTKNITPAQLAQARRVVNDILKRDNKDYNNIISHLNGVFGTKRNEVVFQQRKNIAPAIQKLLGAEEVDASLAVFRTLDTLGTQLTNYKLYDDLYEKGLGKWFFKETGKFSKAADESLKAATIEGKQFLQLDGLRTTPEIAELFNTIARNKGQTRQILERMYGYFLTAKGSSQAAATVFNSLTHVRNTLGGSIILMRNGINPFTNETIKSSQILRNDLFTMDATKKNKVLSDLYEEYQRLGIVNQNVRVGEFKNLINDLAANPNENIVSKFPEIFKKAGRKATSVYVAEDDLWRIVAYNKELNTLKKAYPDLVRRNLQDLKQEAADVVRATMPTYDLIPKGLQELRKLPIGNFFSFTAEQFRNNYNTMMRAAQELRSGNKVIQDRGMNRLASQVTSTYLFSKGITDFSKLAFGISDEDERAVRDLNLAPWSKNSALLFSRDNKGNIQYIDLTYTDPSAPVTDNFRNILNLITDPTESMETVNRNVIGQTVQGLEFFLRPFVSESLLTEAITDILVRGGKTKEGFGIKVINPITKEPLTWEERIDNNNLAEVANNMDVALAHILETVLPREVTDIASLTRGKKAIRIEEGKTSLQRELLGKLTGQRLVTINPDKIKNDFSFKLRDLNRARGIYQGNINSSITKNMKAESVLSRYKEENNKNYKEFVKSKRMLDAAKHFDIDPYDIESLVKENLTNYTKDEKSTFLYSSNEYIPLKISDEKLDQAYKDLNFENINFREFYDAYTVSYLEYSQLPLLEEEIQREKELKRKGFFLGGPIGQSQLDIYEDVGEDLFSGKLTEQTTEFFQEREKRRTEAHRQIAEATKEGDVRKGFEAFETLPIGEQFAGYMNPVTNVPLSAAGAGVYAEKAQPSFKSPKEFLLDFVNPMKLNKTPIKVEDPLSAGIAVAEATGLIPAVGVAGRGISKGLRKIQARRGDDTMGGGGSGKPPISRTEEIIKFAKKDNIVSPTIEGLITDAPRKLRGPEILQWMKGNVGQKIKPKEMKYLEVEDYINKNPKATVSDVIENISNKKVEVGEVTYKDKGSYYEDGGDVTFYETIEYYDPIDDTLLYQYRIDDIEAELAMGDKEAWTEAIEFLETYNPKSNYELIEATGGVDTSFDELIMTGDATENFNNLKTFINEKLDGNFNQFIEDMAESQYERNPFKIILPEGDIIGDSFINTGNKPDTFAFGNEDVGYQIFIDGRRFTEGPDSVANQAVPYSRNEAELQLQRFMEEEGLIEDVGRSIDGPAAKHKSWIDKNLPGGTNYEEKVYTWENAGPNKSYVPEDEHYPEDNQIVTAILRDRKLKDGTTTKHADEIQSDIHSDGYKYGYRDSEYPKQIENLNERIVKYNEDSAILVQELKDLFKSNIKKYPDADLGRTSNKIIIEDKLNALEESITDALNQIDSETGVAVRHNAKFININNLFKEVDLTVDKTYAKKAEDKIENLLEDLSDISVDRDALISKVPDYPYKDNYYEIAIKKIINQAIEEDLPAVSVSTSDAVIGRWGKGPDGKFEKFYKNLYDNKIPKFMKKFANEYGGKFQRSNINPSDVNSNYQRYINPDYVQTSTSQKFLDSIEDGVLDANVIIITDEMREKILKEGVKGFAKGGLVRQQYFKGEEVSKDFPVTDVKETAADRVDPFTGQPYSAQMEELGLDVFQER